MREKLLFIFLCIGFLSFGQLSNNSSIEQDSLTTINDSIVLLYDTLPAFTYFNADTISTHTSKIAAFQDRQKFDYPFFLISLLFSLLLTVLVVLFKPMIKALFKSIIDANFSYQYIRIQKHNNVLAYLLFTSLFTVVLSVYFYYGFGFQLYFWNIFVAILIYIVYDILSNYLFVLFTKKNIKEHLLYSTLSYYTIAALLLWPFLLIIHVNLPALSKHSFFMYVFFLVFIAALKLLRLINVLNQEKVKTISFHFFIYLCTFKIAPILILIRLLF